jgi:hypothetical protein
MSMIKLRMLCLDTVCNAMNLNVKSWTYMYVSESWIPFVMSICDVGSYFGGSYSAYFERLMFRVLCTSLVGYTRLALIHNAD